MSLQKFTIAIPASTRVSQKPSQYQFEQLVPGSQEAFVEVVEVPEGGDVAALTEKAKGKLVSATVAYRKRMRKEGNTAAADQRFAVRGVTVEIDGMPKPAVGVWALAPKAPKADAVTADAGAETATV